MFISKDTGGDNKLRLIDSDKLKDYLFDLESVSKNTDTDSIVNTMLHEAFIKFIDEQPTAYNVDKVVDELKKCHGIVSSCSIDYAEGLKDAYERAIDIVRLEMNKEGD